MSKHKGRREENRKEVEKPDHRPPIVEIMDRYPGGAKASLILLLFSCIGLVTTIALDMDPTYTVLSMMLVFFSFIFLIILVSLTSKEMKEERKEYEAKWGEE